MDNTIEFKIGKKKWAVRVPASWNDLDLHSLALYYGALFDGTGSEYTRPAFTAVKLISLTQHVLNIPADYMIKWEADRIQSDPENGEAMFLDELKSVIGVALGGLFDIATDEETGATTYAVKFNLTKNPWPALNDAQAMKPKQRKPRKVTWYYAPKDGLANITLYEMAYAFAKYEDYTLNGNDQAAIDLIAALYRPSRSETRAERESAWFGDRRIPLRRYEDKIAERAKLVETLPLLTRRLIVFWFAGCREAIVKQYPKVFKATDGDGGQGYGWGGLILRLAEGGTFGTPEQTSDQHFSNILTYLSLKEDDRVEAERAMEQAKTLKR